MKFNNICIAMTLVLVSMTALAEQTPSRSIQSTAKQTNSIDFYYYNGKPVKLQRSLDEYVVQFHDEISSGDSQAIMKRYAMAGQRRLLGQDGKRGMSMVKLAKRKTTAALERSLATLKKRKDVSYAGPVFVHPSNGAKLVCADEIVVKLKAGRSIQALLSAYHLSLVRPLWGTTDEYVLRVPEPKRISALDVANEIFESGVVVWAQPNFVQSFERSYVPDDPQLHLQWHLTGEQNGRSQASVDALAAWDIEQGNSDIVIAVIDDGIETNHPDIKPNLYVNPNDPINGLDDDGNGFVDDWRGWDFFSGDNIPNPSSPQDNHGTAVAGVAAARGDNGEAVTGVCPRCSVLPIKIVKGSNFVADSTLASAIRYAASKADVLNNSWGGGAPSNILHSAIKYAVTEGRGGKGAVVVFSTGNSASGYTLHKTSVPAGTHRYEWVYSKDGSINGANDTAWLAWAYFPNGDFDGFNRSLSNWYFEGDANWRRVYNAKRSDEGICNGFALRAGRIKHHQRSAVGTVKSGPAKKLWYYSWVASEAGYDGLTLRIDYHDDGTWDKTLAMESGVPKVRFGVSYPAAFPEAIAVGASTNFGCRANYSQFGRALEIVAPSSGGPLNRPITTTDRNRNGKGGYDDKRNYVSGFGGTSSAAPLVAGVAGLLLSHNPDLSQAEVRQILQRSADKVGPFPYNRNGRNNRYGFGQVNAYRALKAIDGD